MLPSVLILLILACIEIDLIIPSFPEMRNLFQLTEFQVEWLLGANLLANGLSCFMVGMLGDRYGRKPIIVIGLLMLLIGTCMCFWAQNYSMLLMGRFLQGIGVAGPAVLSYLVVADQYPVQEQQKIMGTLNGTVTLSMAFAPTIGSYISAWTNWQGNFMALLALSIVALILTMTYIPKGKPNPEAEISFRAYIPLFKSSKLWKSVILISALCSPYWIFIGIAPLLYMQDWGVSLHHFGFYQGGMAASFALLSFTSGYWMRKFGENRCLNFGISCMAIFCILCTALLIFKVNNPIIVTLVGMVQAVGIIFPINLLWPLALQIHPEAKGRATAILGGMRLMTSALGVQLASYFYDGTFLSTGLCMLLGIGIAVLMVKKSYKEATQLMHPDEGKSEPCVNYSH